MNRFTKNERLRSRKQIEHLLSQGISSFVYPFKVTSEERQATGDAREVAITQLLIIVPKRRIKKAVARNLIKRRTREAWRLHKSAISPQHNIILQYVADEPLSYAVIVEAVKIVCYSGIYANN